MRENSKDGICFFRTIHPKTQLMNKKKYMCIAKVGNEKFVRYRENNLKLFAGFLDREFTDWRWFNVYEYSRDGDGPQIGNFTKNNRPLKPRL